MRKREKERRYRIYVEGFAPYVLWAKSRSQARYRAYNQYHDVFDRKCTFRQFFDMVTIRSQQRYEDREGYMDGVGQ